MFVPWYNLYVIKVDYNRNYYNYRRFSHIIGIRKSEDKKKDWNMKTISFQLGFSNNRFTILSRVINNISCYNLNNRNMLREVIVKIGFKKLIHRKKQ